MRRVRRLLLALLILTLLAAGGGYLWMRGAIGSMPRGASFLIRYESNLPLAAVLRELESRGVVRSSLATEVYARIYGGPKLIPIGTYRLAPGMTADELLATLKRPLRQMVRIPETNFSMRTARLLALPKYQVSPAKDYLDLTKRPLEFQASTNVPLSKLNSLEGYLYPDTYDLPPLLGARGVIERQLKAFEAKAWPVLEKQKDPYKILKIASLIELEVAKDSERPIVAGVIVNRLKKGMSLGIDAALNYAIGEWRPLTKKDLAIDSPYNLRTHKGLPPTPICSPTVKSIEAALRPARHDYLYYVVSGLPDRSHRFGKTNAEHERNKRLRRLTEAQLGKSQERVP